MHIGLEDSSLASDMEVPTACVATDMCTDMGTARTESTCEHALEPCIEDAFKEEEDLKSINRKCKGTISMYKGTTCESACNQHDTADMASTRTWPRTTRARQKKVRRRMQGRQQRGHPHH